MLNPNIERKLDMVLQELDVFQNAIEISPQPILPIDFVLAKKYLNSFPQHSVKAVGLQNGQSEYILSPTCCYPVFKHFEGKKFLNDVLITNKSNCFRNEKEYIEGTRQFCFKMREYILFSRDLPKVKRWIEEVKLQIQAALASLGIEIAVEKATDPFFNPRDFQQVMQSTENLKSEFLHCGISLGSINMHLKAFSKSCSMVDENGNHIYTACFGLGYDRVAHFIGVK